MKALKNFSFAVFSFALLMSAGCKFVAGNSDNNPIAVGDIVLEDKSCCKPEKYAAVCADKKAIGVVYEAASGCTRFVGLREEVSKDWCTYGTVGYNNSFATSDTDGNLNQALITNSGLTGDSINNYPAFKTAQDYASVYAVTGPLASNWYIPAKNELTKLYEAREKVNAGLTIISANGGTADLLKMNKSYWSSSQGQEGGDQAWCYDFAGTFGLCETDKDSSLVARPVNRF